MANPQLTFHPPSTHFPPTVHPSSHPSIHPLSANWRPLPPPRKPLSPRTTRTCMIVTVRPHRCPFATSTLLHPSFHPRSTHWWPPPPPPRGQLSPRTRPCIIMTVWPVITSYPCPLPPHLPTHYFPTGGTQLLCARHLPYPALLCPANGRYVITTVRPMFAVYHHPLPTSPPPPPSPCFFVGVYDEMARAKERQRAAVQPQAEQKRTQARYSR